MTDADGTALLAASGLKKRFGALVVLDGVDFSVGADEAVGIVGPNGAGKTTLLSLFAGSQRPDGGTVLFRGADITSSGAYWTPHFPYSSPLTGLSSKQIGDGYTTATGRQWNQQLGASMSLFDVAEAVLKKSGDPKNKTAVANAMKHLSVVTPSGRLHWGTGGARNPVPPVTITPIIGGQWVPSKGKFPLDFVLCEHSDDHNVPIQARLKPYPG